MLERKFIEKILTANGVNPNAADEEIKSVLISANWHKDDVDTAIMVLREDKVTHVQRVDSVQRVFRSDERLNPETISSLLGISIDVNSSYDNDNERGGMRISGAVGIIVVSLVFAVSFVMSAMWYLEMGPFYSL